MWKSIKSELFLFLAPPPPPNHFLHPPSTVYLSLFTYCKLSAWAVLEYAFGFLVLFWFSCVLCNTLPPTNNPAGAPIPICDTVRGCTGHISGIWIHNATLSRSSEAVEGIWKEMPSSKEVWSAWMTRVDHSLLRDLLWLVFCSVWLITLLWLNIFFS